MNETKQIKSFYVVDGSPKVIDAIDCTHVQLVPPSNTEHVYRNRKQRHCLNVQAVCDIKTVITNILAKYSVSVDNFFILRNIVLILRWRVWRWLAFR